MLRKGSFFTCVSWKRTQLSVIFRHSMSPTHRIYWAMCLNMFSPYLVWWPPGRSFVPAPIFLTSSNMILTYSTSGIHILMGGDGTCLISIFPRKGQLLPDLAIQYSNSMVQHDIYCKCLLQFIAQNSLAVQHYIYCNCVYQFIAQNSLAVQHHMCCKRV